MRILLFISLLLFAFPLAAQDKMLSEFFASLKTYSADFTQVVDNPQLGVAAESAGSILIEKPGRFYWEYRSPYVQKIIANGKKLWIYDEDLEQVSIKTLDKTIGQTPAVLLSQNVPVQDSFNFGKSENKDGIHWVTLLPKDTDAGFTRIEVGLRQENLASMVVIDQLGQATRMTFSNTRKNAKIDRSKFQFTPPKGADVFDQTQE